MKKLLFVALSTLLFAACQKEDVSEGKDQFDALSSDQKAAPKKARPLSGNLNNEPVPGIPRLDCVPYGFSLSKQNYLYGTVSHMGRLKIGSLGTALDCSAPLAPGAATYEEIWVAANGDVLKSMSTIQLIPDPQGDGTSGSWIGGGEITGGTGRFAGASGKWDFVNARFFSDGTSSWSIKGEIIY